MSTATSSILTGADANEKARQSNLLSPRFYTTDHAGFDRLSVEPLDRKSTRLNSSHIPLSRMPSSA